MIDRIRKKIDGMDEKILESLNERIKLAMKIGRIKSEKNEDIFVPVREKEIIARLKKLNKGPIPDDSLSDIFREILSASRSVQKNIKVSADFPDRRFPCGKLFQKTFSKRTSKTNISFNRISL